MATELIPGLGYVHVPDSSATELIPGAGYVEFEVAAAGVLNVVIAAYHYDHNLGSKMQILKANTAIDVLIGPFVSTSDGYTAITTGTIDVELSKNGQALANKTDVTAPTHDGAGTIDGYWNCELDATDTGTEGSLSLVAYVSTALPVKHEYVVLSEAAYDSLIAVKDTGYMDVNIKAISEDTAAADTLEASCDTINYCTAITGGSSTTVLCTTSVAIPALVAQADQYNNRQLLFIDGDLQGVQREITDYSESAGTATFTVSTFPGTPDTPGVGDKFIVF